jgi:hypothetical protein
MRKPTSLVFGHRTIKIKYIPHSTASRLGFLAEIEPDKNTIRVDKSLDHPTTLNCIIHELIHLICDHYSIECSANVEELFAECGTNGLLDALSTNPKLLEYLANSLKKD